MAVSGNTVFCDDIRREDNGKVLLIGVYTGGLVVEDLPAKLPLSVWMRLSGMTLGKHKVTFRIDFPGGESLGMDGEAEIVNSTETDDVFMVRFPASLSEEGDIVCNFIVGGETHEVGRLNVQKADKSNQPNNGA